jgi:ABC transporter DrrB family efflux protein
MTNRWRPLLQLTLARLREFYREPAVLFWVYGFPLFLAVGLGLAFAGGSPAAPGVDLRRPPAVDVEETADSAEAVAQELTQAGLAVRLGSAEACRRRLRTGRIALYLVPVPGGCRYVYDPNRPDSLLARYRADAALQRRQAGPAAWQAEDVVTDTPGERYIDFLIPGLMGLNLMGGGLWGVGFVLVDLRARRLLKRLRATPMRRSDFLLSVLASRLIFLFTEMLVLVLAGRVGFGMPVRGGLGALALVLLGGGAAFAGLGLLLACRTDRTEVVSGLINLFMLPMWMLSGTFFPADRFPEVLQPFIHALPLTQLNDALRAVLLEGASLASVLGRLGILAGWAVASFGLALRWFRWL